MSSNSPGASRLTIRRMDVRCVLAGGAGGAPSFGSNIANAIAASLRTSLLATADAVLPDSDPSVWLIRRLTIDFHADANPHRAGTVAAIRIARRLAGVIGGGIDPDADAHDWDGDNVAYYPDAAGLLAAYLADVADGRAAGNWRYRRFEGLSVLPTSAILRTATCQDATTGLIAMQRLSSASLRKVVRCLGDHDAQRVAETLCPSAGAASMDEAIAAAAEAARDPAGQSTGRSVWHDALILVALATAKRPAVSVAGLLPAARAVAGLRALHDAAPARAGTIQAAIVAGDIPAFHAAAAEDAAALLPWLECAAHVAREQLTPVETSATATKRNVAPSRSRATPFGGIFLLLPLIEEIGLARRDRPASLLRLEVVARCMGQDNYVRARGDPLIAELVGFDAPLPPMAPERATADASLRCSLRTIAADARGKRARPTDDDALYLGRPPGSFERIGMRLACALLRNFANRLPGFGASRLPYLYDQFLAMTATLEDEPARRVVRLDRPPLHVLLSLTGMLSRTYTLPWLTDARPVALFPREHLA